MKPEPPAEGLIRLFLCGDVMLGRGLDQALPHPGNPELHEAFAKSAVAYVRLAEQANGPFERPIPFEEIWGAAAEAWRNFAPDLRLMNLETAITTSEDFASKGVNYRMNPANVLAVASAGAHVCALANNHILDFGPSGLRETLALLRDVRIATVGAGLTLAEAQSAAVLEVRGRRISVYAVATGDSGVPPEWAAGPSTPGVARTALTDPAAEALAARIAAARRPDDLTVLSIHWGSNWGYEVPEAHRRFAHALIDSGQVDVVHGHSSHHPRPLEVYRGRLILYGCGDFLNDYEGIRGYEEFRSDLVAGYFADVDAASGVLRRLRLAPFEIRRFRLQKPARAAAQWLAKRLTAETRDYAVQFTATRGDILDATWPPPSARDDACLRPS